MRILILGGSGVVGFHFAHELKASHEVITLARSSKNVDYNFDVMQFDELSNMISRLSPDVIVNAVKPPLSTDAMEKEQEIAYAINTQLPDFLSDLQSSHNYLLVHLSTDWVYEGKEGEIYAEDSPICPLNYYANTKAMAEEAIRTKAKEYLLLRTEGVFGYDEKGTNLLLRLKAASLNHQSLKLPVDKYSQPISGKELSRITANLIKNRARGIFNSVGRDYLSRYDFAYKACERLGYSCDLIKTSVKDKTLPVPAFLRVNINKIEKAAGIQIKDLNTQIDELKGFVC